MPPIQVRDCPASIHEQLKEYAAAHHRSVSQQVLAFIEEGLRNAPAPRSKYDGELTPEEVKKRKKLFAEIAAQPIWTPPEDMPSIVEMIREGRERR